MMHERRNINVNQHSAPGTPPPVSQLRPAEPAGGGRPIGYVVLMKLPDGDSWEPAALTRHHDEAAKQLLVRTCFSMFPTEQAAEAALRELRGERSVRGVEARICAVFPANIAAPHTTWRPAS